MDHQLSLKLADAKISVIHNGGLIRLSLLDIVSLYSREKGLDMEEAYLEFVEWGYSKTPGEFERANYLKVGPYLAIRVQAQEDFEDIVAINR